MGMVKLFAVISLGDRAGSTIPSTYSVWEKQAWNPPMLEEHFDPDRTILSLVLSSISIADKSDESAIETADAKQKVIRGKVEHMPTKSTIVPGRLSDEDAVLFYKLWMGLLDYVNRKHSIDASLGKIISPKGMDINRLLPIRDRLWESESFIDEYIVAAKKALSADEITILEGWKKPICGKFLVMKHLKKYSVLMTHDSTPLLYGVVGIYSTLDEMIPKERLPVAVSSALIPFKGRIMYDSFFRGGNVSFGSSYKKSFNEAYRSSKAQYGIIESLDDVDEILSKHAADSIRKERIQNEILVDTYGEHEEMSAWHCCLKDNLIFPFEAICEKQMTRSPLNSGEKVTVIGLAKMNDCHGGIAVMIKWQDRKFAVPLEQLRPIDSAVDFGEAIEDWKYWISTGYY